MAQSLELNSAEVVDGSATHTLPPGPRGLPGLGVVPNMVRDIYEYFPAVARKYGDVVKLPVPGADLILLSHPDHVNHVMTRHSARYWKGEMNMELIDGEPHAPLPVSDGDTWKRMRKLLSPKFNERSMNELSSKVVDDIIRHLDSTWTPAARTGATFDLESNLASMALSVLLRGAMSLELDDATVEKVADSIRKYAIYAGTRMVMHSVPQFVPRPFTGRGRAAKQYLDGCIQDAIDQRIANPRTDTDMLTLLLGARFDDGEPMTPDELRSEMAGLVFGGFETTSSALSWTFALLAQNPDVEQRAYEEVAALDLGNRNPTFADLRNLTFVRACFDESMRLQGGPLFAREALEDDDIGGFRIPKGSTVMVSPTVLHRDPRFWREPNRFNPSRFETDKIDKNAFIPFNVGQRKCMGMRLAYMEATYTIALVLHRYRLSVPQGFELRPAFRVSTGIKGGVELDITPR